VGSVRGAIGIEDLPNHPNHGRDDIQYEFEVTLT
jgi:hypothetical protein